MPSSTARSTGSAGIRRSSRRLQRRELQEVTRKLDGLINAIADGLRTEGLKSKLEELEKRKERAHSPCGRCFAAREPRLHPNLAEVYRQKVANLQQALAQPGTHTEALEILRGLIEQVVLRPVDKGLEIEIIGEIAAMVDLGAQNKKAGPEGSAVPEVYRRSVKVVAGVSFFATRRHFPSLSAIVQKSPVAQRQHIDNIACLRPR